MTNEQGTGSTQIMPGAFHHIMVRFDLEEESRLSELLELIKSNIEISKRSPDFVSATFLKTQSNKTLINIAVWKSHDAYVDFWQRNVLNTEANQKIALFNPSVTHLVPILTV